MYHEVTHKERQARLVRRVAAVVVVIALAVALFVTQGLAQASAREQAAVSLRESVLSAAKQCCAVEGAYPSSLAHLEEHYGLTINHDDFIVNYEWFADNVLPAVVVVTR